MVENNKIKLNNDTSSLDMFFNINLIDAVSKLQGLDSKISNKEIENAGIKSAIKQTKKETNRILSENQKIAQVIKDIRMQTYMIITYANNENFV
jgi:hypothetical protein